MNVFPYINKRTAMATAIAVTLGSAAPLQTASAVVYDFTWTGLFTMLDPTGIQLQNTSYPYYGDPTWGYGLRTQVSGTFTYDSDTGAGSVTIEPFEFFGKGAATAHDVAVQAIGDGTGGAGTLLAGKMLFDWATTLNINVGIVFDAQGMLGTLTTIAAGDNVTGVGATPASNNIAKGKYPIGPSPVATTAWNTDFHNNAGCIGANTCLEADDGIGGDPMDNGPFPDFSANFDMTSMTLVSRDDLGISIEAPADVTLADVSETPFPRDVTVDLGTPTTFDPPGASLSYCIGTIADCTASGNWIADDATNTITVSLTQTVNTVTVAWRADDGAGGLAYDTQTVTVSVDDTTAPAFTNVPSDFSINLESTSEAVTFEGPTSGHGIVEASDNVDSAPSIQWSLDGLNWTNDTAGADESATDLAAGENIIQWRVTDDAGNQTVTTQRVTVNLPTGIVGAPCVPVANLLTDSIERQVTGRFMMRDPNGGKVGEIDNDISGVFNPAVNCTDATCTDSGAQLFAGQPFFGSVWDTETIRLFTEPGTYTFNACPGSIDGAGNASDGSTKCDEDNELSMVVGPDQIGAHMLFNWSVNRKIDVVVVWNYECGASQLTAGDPDGDGIIGTPMVDGPFKGFNAAFDLTTAAGEPSFTTGGYTTTVGAVNSPTAGASPLPIDPGSFGSVEITAADLTAAGAAADSGVVTSCVGGCFDFSVSGRTPGETIHVVLPLSEPIPFYSLYRKYNPASNTWANFVVNGTDGVKTAPLNADGSCPAPGAGDYAAYSSTILAGMLRPDDQCVQLTITDNGPNDRDPADGVIADPGGVGVTSGPASPETATSGGGGCSLSTGTAATQRLDLWLMAGLLGLFGLRRKLQRH